MESPCLVIRGEAHSSAGSKYPAVVCAAAGKPFPSTQSALVFPHFDTARIKALRRMPDGRFVVELKGVPRRRLLPGSVVIAGGEPVVRSRVGYGVSLRPIPEGVYQARGGLFREHTLPGTVKVTPVASGYRLSASADLPLLVGGSYRLVPAAHPAGGEHVSTKVNPTHPGASTGAGETPKKRPLPHELLLCVPVEIAKSERRRVGAVLARIAGAVSARRIAAANLSLLGWAPIRERLNVRSVAGELSALVTVPGIGETDEIVSLGAGDEIRLLVLAGHFQRIAVEIEKTLRRTGGAKVAEVAREVGHPEELVRAVAEELERRELVARDSGVLVASGVHAGLSPIEKGVLDSLRKGFESGALPRAGKGIERKVLQKLVDIRLAIRIGDRYYAMDTFEALVQRLLRGRNPGEAIELRTARELLGLSREQTVQFLETLDSKGLLRREEHLHRVVRGLGTKQ